MPILIIVLIEPILCFIQVLFLLESSSSPGRYCELPNISHLLLHDVVTLEEHRLLQANSYQLTELLGIHGDVMRFSVVDFRIITD